MDEPQTQEQRTAGSRVRQWVVRAIVLPLTESFPSAAAASAVALVIADVTTLLPVIVMMSVGGVVWYGFYQAVKEYESEESEDS